MGSWADILREVQTTGTEFDKVRRKYLKAFANHTKRNVVAYYSAWLYKRLNDRRTMLILTTVTWRAS